MLGGGRSLTWLNNCPGLGTSVLPPRTLDTKHSYPNRPLAPTSHVRAWCDIGPYAHQTASDHSSERYEECEGCALTSAHSRERTSEGGDGIGTKTSDAILDTVAPGVSQARVAVSPQHKLDILTSRYASGGGKVLVEM